MPDANGVHGGITVKPVPSRPSCSAISDRPEGDSSRRFFSMESSSVERGSNSEDLDTTHTGDLKKIQLFVESVCSFFWDPFLSFFGPVVKNLGSGRGKKKEPEKERKRDLRVTAFPKANLPPAVQKRLGLQRDS